MAAPIFSNLTFVAIQAALKAGDILKRGFGTSYQISNKPGRQNLVTEFDKASEACIISLIKEHFPHHSFLAEESGLTEESGEDDILWIIDPLDGTSNFAHHIPIFTISIAAYHQEKGVCGIVYQPLTQELFIAEKGKGAYQNGVRLKVSDTSRIEESMIISSFPYEISTSPFFQLDRLTKMIQEGVILRNLGSAALALAYIAAGKADAFWMYHLHPWDIAAGKLLIEEAGGIILSYGESLHLHSPANILASNKGLQPYLQKHLFETHSNE